MTKRQILKTISIVIVVIILGSVCILRFWMAQAVKANIAYAQKHYQGNAEDALTAFLQDENAPANDRTHKAIWTLGQIQSKKALPILYKYYKNDPEGKTCYGKHYSVLCQYEIFKAINAIEKHRWFNRIPVRE